MWQRIRLSDALRIIEEWPATPERPEIPLWSGNTLIHYNSDRHYVDYIELDDNDLDSAKYLRLAQSVISNYFFYITEDFSKDDIALLPAKLAYAKRNYVHPPIIAGWTGDRKLCYVILAGSPQTGKRVIIEL